MLVSLVSESHLFLSPALVSYSCVCCVMYTLWGVLKEMCGMPEAFVVFD